MTTRVPEDAMAPFLEILKHFEISSKEKDVGSMMSHFVPEEDIVSFGKRANTMSRSALKQHMTDYFQKNEAGNPDFKDIVVYQFGEAACMCLIMGQNKPNQPDIRVTLFLENHEGQWLIRHRHHSPLPNNENSDQT